MPADRFAEIVRLRIQNLFSETSDLGEELVNSLCNLFYFAEKAQALNFGGLTDLQAMHPEKSKTELIASYAEHLAHVSSCLEAAPDMIRNLRKMRSQNLDVFAHFEEVTVDIFKYKIENAENKNAFRRHAERKLKKPSEYADLARNFNVPFRA